MLDYFQFEYYHAVQKELKQAGGRDLEWKSKYLDTHIEMKLLREYQHWAGNAGRDGLSPGPRMGKDANEYLFYSRLQSELQIDWREVSEEQRRAQEEGQYGRSWWDESEFLEMLNTVKRAHEKALGHHRRRHTGHFPYR